MGILYCKGGQTTEEEMFCNTEPSHEFTYFLDMLASRVPLRGFPANQFNGGLDTKSNIFFHLFVIYLLIYCVGDLTGTETYYTTFEGSELMFHVSTLLPFTPDKSIQIERKKRIHSFFLYILLL